ncbi:MAG: ABC-type transport auxiliary lipoprotein family protein [Smithellaceae bacterium]|nr:membrane integrity-associated transporter subunit PqiC [Syntrophaceae bacterium]MDD4241865.1 ABC-type transport auxiliary lipoprotein family protein [Smithellaceae bacterium]NLX52891.1 hypothetical protein [Deltaproteobacteria bacterium]
MDAFYRSLRNCLLNRRIVFLPALLFCLILTIGCVSTGKPSYSIEKYLLSYPPPPVSGMDRLSASVKFSRFSIAAAYNSTAMAFRGDAYKIDEFNYSRWAVNPADMIGDRLLSDMRESGLFRAVFSRYDAEDGRYILTGGVDELYLRMDKNGKTAVLGITVALSNPREKETGRRLLYQKKYVREEPLQDASPRGYCEAASAALRELSRAIIGDVYAAVRDAAPLQ